ncbi:MULTISPECIES: hypothetical protein [unclassified Streptomyces]|uniref:hypothetical protein n=1 Tax=unclassified Streptomyces TaxID=2593676 RepID=UPI002E7790B8|nr:hypothetical protein [Streptomyces sp. JV176]MEE1800696.1 hypothetical protein [Streptomyces sp. JV176]
MKSSRSILMSTPVLVLLFHLGLAASLASGTLLDGMPKHLATLGGMVLSTVTSALLMKREAVRAFFMSRPTLWFLFLFNAFVAVILPMVLDGTKGILAAVVMGLVSLGAGSGLLRSPRKQVAGGL